MDIKFLGSRNLPFCPWWYWFWEPFNIFVSQVNTGYNTICPGVHFFTSWLIEINHTRCQWSKGRSCGFAVVSTIKCTRVGNWILSNIFSGKIEFFLIVIPRSNQNFLVTSFLLWHAQFTPDLFKKLFSFDLIKCVFCQSNDSCKIKIKSFSSSFKTTFSTQ